VACAAICFVASAAGPTCVNAPEKNANALLDNFYCLRQPQNTAQRDEANFPPLFG